MNEELPQHNHEYNHLEIEKKWQNEWKEKGIYEVQNKVEGKENYFTLVEFTYPSGNLHVGHWYAFAVPDIFARYKRMQGYNVLYPMGFDAFGLPAENAAIKLGADPKVLTYTQMDKMREQFYSMGAMFPWEREVISCDPAYYKWTQWMFNQFLKNDLVYRDVTKVNWCPKDQTILANEQVTDNKCERCGTEVVIRDQEQWMLRITKYADRLIDDLDEMNWPNEIKLAQKNWIGRSEGSEIGFSVKNNFKYVLLHGYTGSPENNFFPWLKKELEKNGAEVIVPNLPNSDDPKVYDQVDFVLNNISFDENTVLVGHSLGGVVALKVLEKLSVKIKKTVLVGSYAENHFLDEDFSEEAFDWKFDAEKSNKHTKEIILLRDLKDTSVPQDNTLKLHEIIGGKLFNYVAEEPHFCGAKEPSILENCVDKINVFTTRADTLFGVTYVVLAPEHELVLKLKDQIENWDEVENYIKNTKKKSELERQQTKEKTGVELKGVKVINPANNEMVSVWIADYVLASYGTGAVMAVPAHDERDFEFAKKYNLEIKNVIFPKNENVFGVGALLQTTEGKFLFQKRDLNGNEPGKTVTFGGKKEENETITQCLFRELKEELDFEKTENNKIIPASMVLQDGKPHVFFLITNVEKEKLVLHEGESIVQYNSLQDFLDNANTSEKQISVVKNFLEKNKPFLEYGTVFGSGEFDGMNSEDVKQKITEFVGGKRMKTYRLRDWGISRQRYWGTPIPIVYDPQGNAHAIPDEHLPWILPTDVDHTPEGTAPLARSRELLERTEKIFGKGWKPEVETMDTFVDSSWYFYRYLDPKNDNEFSAENLRDAWMPIDLYMGGAEHTTMHLLYSRFWTKALLDLGLVKENESYKVRRNRGLILGPDGEKMSKSKGNVINPDEIVDRLGADTVRLYLAFMGPYGVTTNYPWDPNGVVGVRRFLERVWRLSKKYESDEFSSSPRISSVSNLGQTLKENSSDSQSSVNQTHTNLVNLSLFHKTIKKVTEDMEEYKFNTAISAMMILLNAWEKNVEDISIDDFKTFLKLLSPFAPHMTEELWFALEEKESIHLSSWPKYDEKLLVESEITLAIQINGKVRSEIKVATEISEDELKDLVFADPKVLKYAKIEDVIKFLYIKGKIVNIVSKTNNV